MNPAEWAETDHPDQCPVCRDIEPPLSGAMRYDPDHPPEVTL